MAKPTLNQDSTSNMMKWHCEIPGPKDTPWENGIYTLIMDFSFEYPVRYILNHLGLQSVFLNHHFLTPISTHLELFVYLFWTRKKIGSHIWVWRPSWKAFKNCSGISLTSIVQLNRNHWICTGTIANSTSEKSRALPLIKERTSFNLDDSQIKLIEFTICHYSPIGE